MGNKASKPVNRQKSKSVTFKTQAIKSKGLWVIGKNEAFELGIGSLKSISLKRIHKDHNIEKIYVGCGYNIYSNREHTNIGVSGTNSYQKDFRTLSKISYFNDQNITVEKICVGLNGKTTFWISNDQRLYVNGCNDQLQAGINSNNKNYNNTRIEFKNPKEITEIRGTVDVQTCNHYSIALCNVESSIIAVWSRIFFNNTIIFSNDVISLISEYCRANTRIYVTLYHQQKEDKKLLSKIQKSAHKWKQFKRLKGVTVTKIKSGFDHCLLLTSIGTVYSYGGNEFGQCGQMISPQSKERDDDAINMPLMITYFRQYQKITIKEISCGAHFSLVLAKNGKVFAFGNNEYGQLGNGRRTRKTFNENVSTPLMIKTLEKSNVKSICCGYYHAYAVTDKNKHYLWGSNLFNECMTYDSEQYALELNLINPIVHKNVRIKSVYLGKHNTLFIVERKAK